ncbi:MAG: hypothetical protein UZ20_WS6002000999 [candidate division WS6 bacterium OLB21]|uniref:Carotene biosynthesis associated membrane protein n=1 Tax=candidate division WS6 bacterium OLB21 TaxID=1617427 RepID=A0A136KF99_9BACT|nr:MAG: hypothetical protein UZ20_WS6002000999 [candidate division WS6 bacterium OLB21]
MILLAIIALTLAFGSIFVQLPDFFSFVPDLTLLLFASPLIYLLIKERNISHILAATFLFVAGFLLEHLSSLYGFPYGKFSYANEFLLNLAGTPIVIGIAWMVIIMGVRFLVPKKLGLIVTLLVSAFLAVAVDLVIDPPAVQLGYWTWVETGPYYNIPISNFFGWFLAGLLLTSGIFKLTENSTTEFKASAFKSLFLIVSYWTFTSIMLGMIVPFIVGISLMILISRAGGFEGHEKPPAHLS